jgi:hypothetical protein
MSSVRLDDELCIKHRQGCKQRLTGKKWTKSLKSERIGLTRTNPTQEAKMEFSTYLTDGLIAAAKGLVEGYSGEREGVSLAAMERMVQGVMQQVGNGLLSSWLNVEEGKYPADRVKCSCGGMANYVRQREAVTITLQGRVSYRRAYYGCACGQGCSPLDDRLGIAPGEMSATVKAVAALFGVQAGFATSSVTLAQVLPLTLSPNSIRAACQEVGEQVLRQESDLISASQSLQHQTATQRHLTAPRCLYVSLAGFQAPFEDGWHELKAGVFWTVDAKGHATHKHYFVDTVSADEFAPLVWAKGWQYGADLAERLVFIADGSAWIWRMAQTLFPNAIQIVDWFHASAYLAKIAVEAFGEGTAPAKIWYDQHATLLYEGHLAALMRACRAIQLNAPIASDAARRYFANNRTRLRYPHYRALGLQIGSGVMESACKQIGLLRLKLAGARWSKDGARKLAKARAAFLSDKANFAPFTLPQVA